MDSFQTACTLLPPGLRERAQSLPAPVRGGCEELRLRVGRLPTVLRRGDELPLPGDGRVTRADLERTVEIATRASVHSALEYVKQGYFTVKGGHRIGLCGTVITEEGRVKNLSALSSLNVRLAHAVPGCGEDVLKALIAEGAFHGALLIAPPGGGKTTLLRDLCRLLGERYRVGLCDERGEVAALWEGEPQFDVGPRTDVLEGCSKNKGLLMLLRGMNPQILACDEITAPGDVEALAHCANCGVELLATVHGEGVTDLRRKPLYRALLERGIFRKAVVIFPTRDRPCRVEDLP